jgi:UDP-2,3-diacylglucosamine hydrolase
MDKLAILAGGGLLPRLIVDERVAQDKETFIVAFKGFTDPEWVANHPHVWVRLGQLGKMFKALKHQEIERIVFAGHIRRPGWNQIRPDLQGLKLLWKLSRQKLGDDSLLRRLAAVFQEKGIELIGADSILPQCVMPSGELTNETPSDKQWKDIFYAYDILLEWAKLDQGQSIVVQNGLILGVESIEGTDELIRRCGEYKRPGLGPILVKVKKPQQDSRLDMPTIGQTTVQNAIAAGFSGIAVQEKHALFLEPSESLELANKNNLFVAGFKKS